MMAPVFFNKVLWHTNGALWLSTVGHIGTTSKQHGSILVMQHWMLALKTQFQTRLEQLKM